MKCSNCPAASIKILMNNEDVSNNFLELLVIQWFVSTCQVLQSNYTGK